MKTDKEWANLTWQEKREERFKRWLDPGATFASPEAARLYRERVTRFVKAIKLEEPDRVPVILPVQHFPAYYAGFTLKDVMYDYEKLRSAWLKFLEDFDSDAYMGAGLVFPGKVLEMLDYKLQKWPGHGLADDLPMYQYIEGEYMPAADYDALIRDPSDYLTRRFLPATNGALAGFRKLNPATIFVGIPVWYVAQFADPDIRASVLKMLDAAQETARWGSVVAGIDLTALQSGLPNIWGGMSGAPFDMIGDMLRGTHGIMMDMFQRPDKLQEAMERLVPIAIDEAVSAAEAAACPVVVMPLHKGTGGFMSNEQFERFYWPTFKKVLLGLVEEGLVPMPFAEGNYEARLEIIADMPRSSIMWYFEHMDMAHAKQVLGDTSCIVGNVPVTMLYTGTPQDVKDYCRRLIDDCGPGGGYIMTGSASVDKASPDNLRAMMEAAREYGVYH